MEIAQSEMRIQKYLADNGIMSRRAAEKAVADGKVTVNGKPAEIGQKVNPETDTVVYNGTAVGKADKKYYVILNKPVGFVTTMSDEFGRRCVAQLLEKVPGRVYPVGRLDKDSEGLLVCTNDGELANRLMHPRYQKSKLYTVKIEGTVTEAQIKTLTQPMLLDGYLTAGAEIGVVEMKNDITVLAVRLREGRNREIRKMCESLELSVLSLKRIEIDGIRIGNLKPGEWRFLTANEIAKLKRETKC